MATRTELRPGDEVAGWRLVARAANRPSGTGSLRFWLCRCECGTLREVQGSRLARRQSTSCGCRSRVAGGGRRYDLVGRPFGRLRVLGLGTAVGTWACRCACGGHRDVLTQRLLAGTVRSCGCLRREILERADARRLSKRERKTGATS